MLLSVTADNQDPSRGTLEINGTRHDCRLGKNGVTHDKQEGDGKTPLGTYFLRELWFRPDIYHAPQTALSCREIIRMSGWSDDPKDLDYNRPVVLPHTFHHEKLMRDDRIYNLLIPLGYNDSPAIARKGSAIFFHLTSPEDAPTEGCVAISPNTMLSILPILDNQIQMLIQMAD